MAEVINNKGEIISIRSNKKNFTDADREKWQKALMEKLGGDYRLRNIYKILKNEDFQYRFDGIKLISAQ